MFSKNKDILLCNHNYQSQEINNDTIPQSDQPTYSNFALGRGKSKDWEGD